MINTVIVKFNIFYFTGIIYSNKILNYTGVNDSSYSLIIRI